MTPRHPLHTEFPAVSLMPESSVPPSSIPAGCSSPKRIWVIGGTQESALLAQAIDQQNIAQTITVTTESARSLYPSIHPLNVWVVVLTPKTLPHFLASQDIGAILDASHPFATGISQLAIATAVEHNLPYIRYERPRSSIPHDPPHSIRLDCISTLFDDEHLRGQRVLLTLGYRLLHHFRHWHDRSHLFARILPSSTALNAAHDAGFTSKQLIALRPPLSHDLEAALYQHWNISTVVTKASGAAGGEDIKQQVTERLGIKLITLDRPAIAYPQQTSDVGEAIAFCRAHVVK